MSAVGLFTGQFSVISLVLVGRLSSLLGDKFNSGTFLCIVFGGAGVGCLMV